MKFVEVSRVSRVNKTQFFDMEDGAKTPTFAGEQKLPSIRKVESRWRRETSDDGNFWKLLRRNKFLKILLHFFIIFLSSIRCVFFCFVLLRSVVRFYYKTRYRIYMARNIRRCGERESDERVSKMERQLFFIFLRLFSSYILYIFCFRYKKILFFRRSNVDVVTQSHSRQHSIKTDERASGVLLTLLM